VSFGNAGLAPWSTEASAAPAAAAAPTVGVAAEIAVSKAIEAAEAETAAAVDDFDIPLEHLRMRDGSFESDVPVQAIAELFNCHFTIVSQVNPHIIPFFYHNRGRDGRPSTWRLWAGGWRGGFVLSALELWLKEDMLKTLRVLAGLDLLIEVFGVNWSYLYLQEARGDVTLIPDAGPRDYWVLIDNLTHRSELHRRVAASERVAWQCMSRIEHRMTLQANLDRACRTLGLPDH
jgi:predicted acylesterase/phospholipase RssA